MRIHVDKIGSVTRNLRIRPEVTLTPDIVCQPGAVLAGRLVGEKSTYNQLEDVHGRLNRLHGGDIILGALGHRNALQGYVGVVPDSLKPGDRIHVLNMGGVMGRCVSHAPDVGAPFELEVLGQVLTFPDFGSRLGQPAFIQQGALPRGGDLPTCPVVYIAGTCMNAGKTHAACALVRRFRQAGLRVGGVKLTGVSLMRDVLAMRDDGAVAVADFTDAGIPTTNPATAVEGARAVFASLAGRNLDVIVAETGDGILGEYGVQAVLADPDLRGLGAAFLLCANDPVGVLGGVRELEAAYGIQVDVVTGPATDNAVGVAFVERATGIAGLNARTQAQALADFVLAKLQKDVEVGA